MRWYLVNEFEHYLPQMIFHDKAISVAMIGGYSSDPEIEVLSKNFQEVKTTFFGIDGPTPFEYLDINNFRLEQLSRKYDLVICSQVIEHIWNMSNFFQLLEGITERGGYLWLSCPTSNIPHGSPDYFSAGYTPEFIANNLSDEKWEFLCVNKVGSKRNYVATHLLGAWLSKEEIMKPVLNYRFKPGSRLGNLKKLLVEIPGRLFLAFLNNDFNSESRWATETYVLAKKR